MCKGGIFFIRPMKIFKLYIGIEKRLKRFAFEYLSAGTSVEIPWFRKSLAIQHLSDKRMDTRGE